MCHNFMIYINKLCFRDPAQNVTSPEVTVDVTEKMKLQEHLAAQNNITAAMFTASMEGVAQVRILIGRITLFVF